MFRNNAAKRPSFHLYVTNEVNLRYIIQSFMKPKQMRKLQALMATSPSSSNLVMEIVESNGQHLVSAYYNDQQLVLGGCDSTTCTAENFINYL